MGRAKDLDHLRRTLEDYAVFCHVVLSPYFLKTKRDQGCSKECLVVRHCPGACCVLEGVVKGKGSMISPGERLLLEQQQYLTESAEVISQLSYRVSHSTSVSWISMSSAKKLASSETLASGDLLISLLPFGWTGAILRRDLRIM